MSLVVGRVTELCTQENPDTAPLVASHTMHATTPSQLAGPLMEDQKNVHLSTNTEL